MRLVRRLCPACREPVSSAGINFQRDYMAAAAMAGGWQPSQDDVFYGPEGCSECGGRGYRGHIQIFEVLIMNDEIAAKLNAGALRAAIVKSAMDGGMTTLIADGMRKAAQGLTTLDELVRCLGDVL